jgi:hypothetical protein
MVFCKKIDVMLLTWVYSGDVGGILCCLDIGGPDTKSAHIVSITHLTFNRNIPLAREIEAYERHRNKETETTAGPLLLTRHGRLAASWHRAGVQLSAGV